MVVYSPRWVPFALSSISADIAVDVPPKTDESVSETAVEPNSASPAFVARDAACASRRLIAAAWPDSSHGSTPGERGGVRAVSPSPVPRFGLHQPGATLPQQLQLLDKG